LIICKEDPSFTQPCYDIAASQGESRDAAASMRIEFYNDIMRFRWHSRAPSHRALQLVSKISNPHVVLIHQRYRQTDVRTTCDRKFAIPRFGLNCVALAR